MIRPSRTQIILVAMFFLLLGALGLQQAHAQTRPTFVLVFIPVSWQGTMEEFRAAADRHAQAFITASGIDQYANVETKYVEEILWTSLSSEGLVSQIESFGLQHIPGDRYVGLTDGDIVHRGKSSVAGWTYFDGIAVVCEANYTSVTAHELGHTFGLCDEYAYDTWKDQDDYLDCPNPYPEQCPTDTGDEVTCFGRPVGHGFCIMGPASVAERPAYCSYCAAALQKTFSRLFPSLPMPTPTPLPTSTPVPPVPSPTSTPRPTLRPSPSPTFTPNPTPIPAALPRGTLALAVKEGEGYTLYTFEPSTGDLRRLEQTAGHAYASAWSSDRTTLAFVSDAGTSRGIFLLELSRGELAELWDSSSDEASPTWSPDGDWLAFSSRVTGVWKIYLIPKQGGTPIRLTNEPGQEIDPAWNPRDWTIAFSSDRYGDFDLYTMAIAPMGGQFQVRLTRWTDWPGHEVTPAWSPDGRTIVFAADRGGVFHLYQLHLADGYIEPLTTGKRQARYPTWMPDGEWLVYRLGFDERKELVFLHVPSGYEWVPSGLARDGTFPSAQR